MKLKPQIAIIVVIVFFIAGIAGTQAAGLWKTQNTKVPAKYTSEQLAGVYNPADIRGS